MKILNIVIRGELFKVNKQQHIKRTDMEFNYSPTWLFLGGSPHHWHNRIIVSCSEAFEKPELLKGCLFWDRDHGTMRQWRGGYFGRLPRITSAYITNE